MGQSVSWLSSLLWAKKEIRILILGLVSADKLELGQNLTGFSYSALKVGYFPGLGVILRGGLEATNQMRGQTDRRSGDDYPYYRLQRRIGGQTSIRPYWRCYYANTAAVIFVVDSTDIERLQTASEELAAMLNEDELQDAALLVFANKQDQPGAKGAGEISEALRLGELRDRNWSIMACSAVDGSGVHEGMDWLVVSRASPQHTPIS
ncbi:ADP-ribosylation factor-like protein 1 [Apiospora phragmitis]|uniref:ADP-ribosylation factor-like protein 1 n=1 Tax=Apiospora phragmitis TaxID=2905665 RepID=A0ABR1TS44_9PEZI